jgi:membrane-bound lytic murein transglycosylase D
MTTSRHILRGAACAFAMVGASCASRGALVVSRPPVHDAAATESSADGPGSLPPVVAEVERPREAAPDPSLLDRVLEASAVEPRIEPPELERAGTDALGWAPDIDVPPNGRVQGFIDLFSGRLKGYLEESLGRGARYLPMIREVFEAEGLPLDLAYIPLIESAFKPTAVSRARATGMWQFMRGTALENGLKHDWYIDERADPEKATRAAAKYLKTLYGTFGDWYLALASYNAGPGRVQRAMKRSGRSDFWAISASRGHLPRETRDYVPLILAAITIARQPGAYGLTIAPAEERPHETVTLARAIDLKRVAEWTGTQVEDIQSLNPELRRRITPVGVDEYVLKVPVGSASIVAARLAELPSDEPLPVANYVVEKGDTLWALARKFDVNRADLADVNQLSSNARLAIGQILIVPTAPPADEPAVRRTPTDSDTLLASATAAAGASAAPAVHRVRRGDTLYSIARRYGTSVAFIKHLNGLTSNLIRLGQRLRVRTPALSTN